MLKFIPAQGHAGVFGCLTAGEHLVVAHPGLILQVQDIQGADLDSGCDRIQSQTQTQCKGQ